MPAIPSGSLALPSTRPCSSCTSTSWFSSAQSSPTSSSTLFLPTIHNGQRSDSLRENQQQPNEPVLTPQRVGTTPHQRSRLPTTDRGTIYPKDSTSRSSECSSTGGYRNRV